MTSSTVVVFGSRPSATTRCITSRSLKIPSSTFPSTMATLPTFAPVIAWMASSTVAVRDTVTTNLLRIAINFLLYYFQGLYEFRYSLNRIVKSIAFHRVASRIANLLLNLDARHPAFRRRARPVNDAFLHDGPIQIVRPKPQRNLREVRRQRHPVGFDV